MLKSSFRHLAAVFVVACSLSAGAHAQTAQSAEDVDARLDSLFGAHEPYHAFFDRLKRAVAAKDKNAVAGMIAYPVAIHRPDGQVIVRTKKDFLARYDQVFTPKLVDVVDRQDYAALFVRDEGAMIGDGEIWFSGVCRDQACKQPDIRIIAFNLS